MNKTKKIWKNGQWIAWHKAQTHVLTHALHYGSAVFEGIRCYQGKKGTAIFKLEEHIDRFFFSAKQLGMKIPYTFYEICDATINTVKKNRCSEGYIRPLAYYGYGSMKLTPSPELPIDVIIACWPWGDYLPVKTVDVVTSPFIRIHPKSTITEAKISGHYVNSILAGLAIQNSPYHEAILLDSDGFVAEGSAENIFIVKDNKLITTPKGTILVGITRNSVIEIAKEQGVEFEERVFKKEEIYTADEAFFCGTAVEITPIRSLDNQVIASGKIGKITEIIKNQYHKMIRGEIA
ncbi:MAG: branched-chain amino acid transaminase, partial [Pseudomonadota bacterium]